MYVRIKAAVEERAYLAAPAEAALSDKGFATFVRTARCDSVNEAEFWVFLQTRGGHFARTSLARLAWNGGRVYLRGSKVCMCGRLWPVLYVESPLPMIFFPQVWFRRQFGPRRVDALVAVAGGGWFALEVNGEWHSGKRDHLRPMELGLPVVKLLPEELSSDQLLEQIQARYECAREAMG